LDGERKRGITKGMDKTIARDGERWMRKRKGMGILTHCNFSAVVALMSLIDPCDKIVL